MSRAFRAVKLANADFRRRLTLMHHELAEVYTPAITRNKDKLIELIREQAERAAKSEFAKKIKTLKGFYTLEMSFPTAKDDMKKILKDVQLGQEFFKTGAYMHMTVKQAWLLFLVGLEVLLWFFIGETIGKWHVVGYDV